MAPRPDFAPRRFDEILLPPAAIKKKKYFRHRQIGGQK